MKEYSAKIGRRDILVKPGFWTFQIVGWLIYLGLQYYLNYKTLSGFIEISHWVSGWFFGFLVTLLLRELYKWFYNKQLSIFSVTLVILAFSFFGAFIWQVANSFVAVPILKTFIDPDLNGFKFTSLVTVLNQVLYMSFPMVIWSTLYFGIKFWLDLIDEKERGEKSFFLAQTAQLKMLRYQLNPHFLFNSLSSIQALIYEDPKQADIILTQLSDFLRFTLRDTDKIFIPLSEEVEIVEKYLSIEKTRFPDRLKYIIDVKKNASEIEVIAFLLQPFVENAVKFGMRTSPESQLIMIEGFIIENKLNLQIKNIGKWVEPNQNGGTGIKNVKERLESVYPDNYEISIEKGHGEVKVSIIISL